MHLHPGADHHEQSRDDVHLYAGAPERPDRGEEVGVPLAREGEDDPIDGESTNDLEELGDRAKHVQLPQVEATLLWARVDESEQIESILAMLEQLAGDQLPDVARTDDDRVLEVGALPPRNRSHADSRHGHA